MKPVNYQVWDQYESRAWKQVRDQAWNQDRKNTL